MRNIFTAAALAAVALHARPADACGGLVAPAIVDTRPVQTAQTALIVVGASTTDLVLAIDVPGVEAAFGVLVPVPVEPTISDLPVSTAALSLLEERTRPVITKPAPDDEGGGGCGCASRGLGAGDVDVTTGDAVDVGPVTAQWLSGATGEDVTTWLTAEGFVLPDGAQDTIDAYVAAGMSFVAMKRSGAATGAERVGVRLTLDGDRRAYAMKMARVGAADAMTFTIFVAAAEAVGPDAPWTGLTLSDLDADLLANDTYEAAVAAAVEGAGGGGGKAFVVESVTDSDDVVAGESGDTAIDAAAADLAAVLPGGLVVTRLTTIVAPDDMDDDATFTSDVPDGDVGTRTLGAAVPSAGAAWPPRLDFLLFVALLGALRVVSISRPRRAA